MKKNLACILAVILCCCAACAAAETASPIPPGFFEDATGVSFVRPEGWLVVRTDWENRVFPFTMVLTPFGRDPLVSLIYHPVDIWPVLAPYLGTMGFARADIGPALMANDWLASILVPSRARNEWEETHNGTVYRVFEDRQPEAFFTTAVTVRNGYLFYFVLSTPGEPDAYLPEFTGWLDSVAFEK